MKFELNKRGLEQVVNDAMKKRGAEMQRAFDAVHRSHAGKPVGEVRTALQSACRRAEMTPDAKQLDSWSKLISEGTRIVLDIKPKRL